MGFSDLLNGLFRGKAAQEAAANVQNTPSDDRARRPASFLAEKADERIMRGVPNDPALALRGGGIDHGNNRYVRQGPASPSRR